MFDHGVLQYLMDNTEDMLTRKKQKEDIFLGSWDEQFQGMLRICGMWNYRGSCTEQLAWVRVTHGGLS